MVNVVIYLKKEQNAIELVKYLLTEKLIASASIDENNVSYKLGDNGFQEQVYSVITAQSKAILFLDIVRVVEAKTGIETPINSVPIIGSNKVFDESIRSTTTPIQKKD